MVSIISTGSRVRPLRLAANGPRTLAGASDSKGPDFLYFFAVILTPKNFEDHIFHSFSRILPTSIFLGVALNKTIQFGWIIMTHTQTGGL